MPEIIILSGKGGTGKTTLSAAFASLAQDAVICDLDVDAPDLHLLLRPDVVQHNEFYSGNEAVIDEDRCIACGECAELCRFDAISEQDGTFHINPLECEGCKVCVHFCPEEAIDFPERHCGSWYVSNTRFGPMVHAQLFPGQENSGRLVSLLRQQARDLAKENNRDMILCDGTPGIGCPVISSLSGADLAVAVTEPTPSGRHDLERVLELASHFRVPAGVIINKHDLNPDQSRAIGEFCQAAGLPVLAQLPHDPQVVEALVRGKVITEYIEGGLSQELAGVWRRIEDLATRGKDS